MRYDRGYGMGMRYGGDYRGRWPRPGERSGGMYDREFGHGGNRYDRPFRGGYGAGRMGYGSDYREQGSGGYGGWQGSQRYRGANRFPRGGWSGAYGPRTGLSERQHWYSPWTDPVPGGGLGMSVPYGMRFGEWL